MRRDQFPSALRGFYFGFDWDNRKLWHLDLPVEAVSMSELEWHLNMPFWTSVRGQPLFDLIPNEVLQRIDAYPHHKERLEKSDPSVPIDIMWSGDRVVILDGMHRLAKLKLQGATHVRVRKVPRELISQIKKDESEEQRAAGGAS